MSNKISNGELAATLMNDPVQLNLTEKAQPKKMKAEKMKKKKMKTEEMRTKKNGDGKK